MITSGLITGLSRFIDERAKGKTVEESLLPALASGCIGAIGGALPDILEPPTDPSHRKIAHSISAGYLGYEAKKAFVNDPTLDPLVKMIIHDVAIGYATHLIQDATTPKGLPLI